MRVKPLEIVTTRKHTDIKGWEVLKGTHLYIMKVHVAKHPMTGKEEQFNIVKIDNGTGHLDLMPETCIKGVLR